MNKKHGLFCVVLGALLLIAAVSLVLYNKNENEKSGEAAQSVLVELVEIIPPPPTEPITEIPTAGDILAEYDIEPTTVPKEEWKEFSR